WIAIFLAAVPFLLSACAPAQSTGSSTNQVAAPSGPKKISMVLLGDPGFFSQAAYRGQGRIPGIGSGVAITTSGLTSTNADGKVVAMLGTGVPSTNEGSWRVFPDGTMETTSTLRPNTFWHDGTPLTADDLAFSVHSYLDKDL